MKYTQLLFLFLLTYSFQSTASIENCQGKVKDIAISKFNTVRIKTTFRDNWFTICKLDGKWKDVPENVCKAYISQVDIALTTQKDISLYYPEGTDCSTLTSDNAPSPDWLILRHQ